MALRYGICAAVALCLSAVQFFPFYEMAGQSVRAKMDFETSCGGALRFSRLVTFVAPKFFGYVAGDAGVGSTYWGLKGGTYFFWETALFVGMAPLFFALRGLLEIRERPAVLFLAIMAGLLLLLALGGSTPLYKWVFYVVPGFGKFRIPGRFLFLFTFCLALLAGFGAHAFLGGPSKKEAWFVRLVFLFGGLIICFNILFLIGMFDQASPNFSNEKVLGYARRASVVALVSCLIAAAVVIVGRRTGRRKTAVVFLMVFTFGELFAFGRQFGLGTQNPRDYYSQADEILKPVQKELEHGAFRVQGRLFQGGGKGQMLFPRNLGNVKMVPLVEGYNPLLNRRYQRFLETVRPDVVQKLLNVRYIKAPNRDMLVKADALPRFYLTPHYTLLGSEDKVVDYLNSPGFQPGQEVVLEKPTGMDLDSAGGPGGGVKIITETPNYIELEVDAPGNMLLATGEIQYPAWKAYIDGRKTEVLTGNYLFRTLAVPKGRHRVVIRFQSGYFTLGALISLIALLVILKFCYKKEYWIAFKHKILNRHGQRTSD
jgi:hypothetical protein